MQLNVFFGIWFINIKVVESQHFVNLSRFQLQCVVLLVQVVQTGLSIIDIIFSLKHINKSFQFPWVYICSKDIFIIFLLFSSTAAFLIDWINCPQFLRLSLCWKCIHAQWDFFLLWLVSEWVQDLSNLNSMLPCSFQFFVYHLPTLLLWTT